MTPGGESLPFDEALKYLIREHTDTTFMSWPVNTNKEVLNMAEGRNKKKL